ncbi:serine protease [Geobacter sp.]|uniref:serine protease n=1 Tax=Geobacter sp. TaxID=46610 RepID=UPI0027B8E423|nr:serine protease [Geobacter sp.]
MKALALLIILYCAAPAFAEEAEKVFDQVRDSVVTIASLDEQGQVEGEGSGVVIGPGQVVTNCHVVQDAVTLRVRSGDKQFPATVLSGNIARDFCRLEVKDLTAPSVTIRISTDVKPGEPVHIVGNPLGFGLAVGSGLVSAIKRTGDDIHIYTSAPTSPGSSGGGLFDAQGRLIGITTARYLGAQNFNLALPAEWVTELIKNGAPWKTPPMVEPDSDWLGRAESLREAGEWAKLEGWARSWKEFWPTSALADELLGLALLKRDRKQDAMTALLSALQKDPQNAAAYGYRAELRRIIGDKKGALEDIRRAQELNPSSGYFYRTLAYWLREDKDREGAVTAVEAAVRREPWDWLAWELLGELRHDQQQHQEAEKGYRTVLRLKPGEPTAAANLASVLAFLGKPDTARQTLTKGTPVDTTQAAKTWLNIGAMEGKNQRFAESEKAFRKALELNPDLAVAWTGLGMTLRTTGRATEAEEAFRKALKLDQSQAGAWLNLGDMLNERGDTTAAKDAYEKATIADPSLAPAWFALGSLYREQRNVAATAKAFAEAARLDPANADSWAFLGEALIRSGQGEKANDALRKAENLNPKNEFALQGLALYYGSVRGEQERALEYVERGLAINPASPIFWSSKGYGLLKLKRYPEAVQALETAIRLQPDFANAWINLGEAHLRQNQIGKAIVALEKALQLSPTAVDARFYAAQCYAGTRQFDKAQSHMDILIRQAPKVPTTWSLQTAIYMEQNKKLEALSAYGNLKSLNPEMAITLRGKYLFRGKQYELPE